MGKVKDSGRQVSKTSSSTATTSKVFLGEKNVIKCELQPDTLKVMRTIFDEKLSPELFRKGDLNAIYEVIVSNLDANNSQEFIVCVVKNPVFNLNCLEGNALLVNFEKIGIFFFKPQHIDLTLPQMISPIDKNVLKDMPKHQDKFVVVNKENFEMDEMVQKYLCAHYIMNYVQKTNSEIEDYELKLIKDIKDVLIYATGSGFWQIFLGDTISFDKDRNQDNTSTAPKREKLIEVSLRFEKNRERRLLAISQKSNKPSFFKSISIAWTNIVVLALMFLMLFLVLGCEEFKVIKSTEIDSQVKANRDLLRIRKQEQESSIVFEPATDEINASSNSTLFDDPSFVPKLSNKLLFLDGMCYLKTEIIYLLAGCIVVFYAYSLFSSRKKTQANNKNTSSK